MPDCSCPERDGSGAPVVLDPGCAEHGLPDGRAFPPMDRHRRWIGRVSRFETAAEVQTRLYAEALAVAPPRQVMHRCAACGKWSHAKKRPRHHLRRAPGDVSIVDPVMERCGPFVSYIANPAPS